MPTIFRSLTVLPVLLLTVAAHAGVEQEKTKCFCDDSGEVYRVAVVATLNDGRGSVGLVNPDGEMIVLNQGETKIGCRLVEVAEMQTSTLAVLDCGQGEVPYRIGDEFRPEPIWPLRIAATQRKWLTLRGVGFMSKGSLDGLESPTWPRLEQWRDRLG